MAAKKAAALDWSKIVDGLGNAELVPGLIELLGSKRIADRRKAFTVLSDERLVHQGTVWPAAVPAVPLIALGLTAEKHPGRPFLLALLAHVAVGTPSVLAQAGADRSLLERLDQSAELDGQAYRAVKAHLPAVTAQLGSNDASTRANAAALWAMLDPHGAAGPIAARMADEEDEGAHVAMALALAVARHFGGAPVPAAKKPAAKKAAKKTAKRTDADPIRAALAIAEAIELGTGDAKAIGAALSGPLSEIETPFGKLGELAPAAASALGPAGTKILAHAVATAPPYQNYRIAESIIRGAFPGAGHTSQRAPLLPSTRFSAAQRDAVKLVTDAITEDSSGPISLLRRVGLPDWREELRRFLGIDPRGPLETQVPWKGEPVEIAVLMDGLARGELTEDEVKGAIVAGVPPAPRVPVAFAAASNDYHLHVQNPGWPHDRAIAFASSLLSDPSCLPAIQEAVAGFDEHANWGSFTLLQMLLHHGGAVGKRDVPMLIATANMARRGPQLDIVRRAIESAPPAVRDAVVAGVELPAEASGGSIGVHRVGPRSQGWLVLDLAVDRAAAAARAADAVAAWTPLTDKRDRHPADEAIAALTALLPEARPAIARALKGATPTGAAVLRAISAPN